MRIIISAIFILSIMSASSAYAKTSLPLPRFVSLKSSEANVRSGPGLRYQIKWVVVRKKMPVEVIGEFEQWRKIRDVQGDEGWMHRGMLTNKRTALVIGETQILRRKPSTKSYPIARIDVNVELSIHSCSKKYCNVQVKGYRGWLKRKNLWGIYPDEIIN